MKEEPVCFQNGDECHAAKQELVSLRAEVEDLKDDFSKRQAAHSCPTWDDVQGDCDCDEIMGAAHVARDDAQREVERLKVQLAMAEANDERRDLKAEVLRLMAERQERDMRVAEAVREACANAGVKAVQHRQQTTDECRLAVALACGNLDLAALIRGLE